MRLSKKLLQLQQVMKEWIIMTSSIITDSTLFKGIEADEISSVLNFLCANKHHYAKGELLQHIGHHFHHAGIVITGEVEESCIIEDFNKIKIGQFFSGDLYGVAFSIGQALSPVQLTALDDCEVLELDLTRLFKDSVQLPSFYGRLMGNLTKFLAQEDIHDTIRMHIASQKNIHDKLIVYLNHLPKSADGYRQIPYSQTDLAAFLGANRSALVRSMSKMKVNGEIIVKKNKIKLN